MSLKALGTEHRRAQADARPLTDAQRTALHRALSEKGTRVRPVTLPASEPGVSFSTACVLVRRGLASAWCAADGDGLVLDRHDRFVDAGRLFITDDGRRELKRVVVDRGETLARIGKSDADEHGHYRDGRDPLDAGEWQDPGQLRPEWSRVAGARHAAVKGWQRRRAA